MGSKLQQFVVLGPLGFLQSPVAARGTASYGSWSCTCWTTVPLPGCLSRARGICVKLNEEEKEGTWNLMDCCVGGCVGNKCVGGVTQSCCSCPNCAGRKSKDKRILLSLVILRHRIKCKLPLIYALPGTERKILQQKKYSETVNMTSYAKTWSEHDR